MERYPAEVQGGEVRVGGGEISGGYRDEGQEFAEHVRGVHGAG